MQVSIVIRAFNEAERIERLLIGIEAQTVAPQEVIVVDSGSTDATVSIARAYGARVIGIDRSEFTFGRALNLGCAAASGDVCVFASGHVHPVRHDWIAELVAPFEDRRVALSYGRQHGDRTNRFSEHQLFAQWFPPESACPQPTYFCNNANSAIRRSAWESLRYDETLPGLEDLAWAKAVSARGGWIAYVAEAEVVHHHDERWAQVRNRYRREAMAMRSIDEHSRFTRGDFVRLLARNVVSDLRAARRQGVLRDQLGSILMFRYNQLAGTYRGFNGPPEVSAQLRARFYYPSRNGRSGHRAEVENAIDYPALESKPRRARQAKAPHSGRRGGASGARRVAARGRADRAKG